jgi:DNA-directed RNA polymerase specialized sigma24 family protein
MPSPNDLKQLGELLHQRLLSSSDLTVTSEIAEKFLPPLVRSLTREFQELSDRHLIDTAAEEALLNLFTHPERFNPARASLLTYLHIRARSYIRNRLGGRGGPTAENKVVELDVAKAVYETGADAEAALISREFQGNVIGQLREVFTDPTDLRVIALMVEGVRETRDFAEALGVADRPADEQQRLVKQAKDRINKTLERKFRRRGRGR